MPRQRRSDAEAEPEPDQPRQNRRIGRPPEESDEERSDAEGDIDLLHDGETVETQLVKKLVRYAIACEYSRTPIRRDGIKEKVLGPHGRMFKRVYAGAQKQLQAVFGMEMMELPSREKYTVEEQRKAMHQTRGPAATSSSYILVSRLPAEYKSAQIIAPSRVQSAKEEAEYVGLYTMLISLITLGGGELSESKLNRYLNRLNADQNMPMGPRDVVLARMIRQGYLDKATRKTGDEDSITWHVGPRGKKEVGPDAIAAFVTEVYGGESEDLEKKIRASLGIIQREPEEDDGAGGRADDSEMVEAGPSAGPSNGLNGRRRGRPAAGSEEDD